MNIVKSFIIWALSCVLGLILFIIMISNMDNTHKSSGSLIAVFIAVIFIVGLICFVSALFTALSKKIQGDFYGYK